LYRLARRTDGAPAAMVHPRRGGPSGALAAGNELIPPVVDLKSVRRAYDRYASIYDFLFGRVLQHGRRELVRALQTQPGDALLEIGVGTGLLLPMYPGDVSVTGIDLSAEMLLLARRKILERELANIELHVMDAENMSFESGRFDHVVISYVYSVTPDPFRLIREARRVCRRGGDIYVVNHFTGVGMWGLLERCLRPFAASLGFRPDFPIQSFVHEMNWNIVETRSVNLLGLSRLVHFKNTI
jgi:phosphatidylethanolamine/phosphatidyl-N-methylethanolamine N-methyltransferase